MPDYTKGGRGKLAPYETVHYRIPKPIYSLVMEFANNYRKLLAIGQHESYLKSVESAIFDNAEITRQRRHSNADIPTQTSTGNADIATQTLATNADIPSNKAYGNADIATQTSPNNADINADINADMDDEFQDDYYNDEPELIKDEIIKQQGKRIERLSLEVRFLEKEIQNLELKHDRAKAILQQAVKDAYEK
jgi:hypothetical protein